MLVWTLSTVASDKEEKENKLAHAIKSLSIQDGIVDVLNETNGNITLYIGGRGSATAGLVKISKVKSEDHALRIAEAAANRSFTEFIKKNVDACFGVEDTIIDSSMNLDDIIQRMNSVTENDKLSKNLRPEDRAAIMKAVLDQVITYIRSSSKVETVTTFRVKANANQVIRGMTLFGAKADRDGDEMVAVKVFKWSPDSAEFARRIERGTTPPKGGQQLVEKRKQLPGPVYISPADDF